MYLSPGFLDCILDSGDSFSVSGCAMYVNYTQPTTQTVLSSTAAQPAQRKESIGYPRNAPKARVDRPKIARGKLRDAVKTAPSRTQGRHFT